MSLIIIPVSGLPRSRVCSFVAMALACATSATALAEGETVDTLEEIVVTAQFRETKLQDTPIAITAISADMLEARSQGSVSEIANQAPNVVLKPSTSVYGPGMTAFIRGVGQSDSSFALEPGVGMYIDDVYYSTIVGSDFDLMDLQRIEVLRGPQGTLAGKNSIGGAVKLYSRKPDGDNNGFMEVTYGSYQRHDFSGGTNFTLVPDQLFARISGVSKTHDGYMNRIDYGCSHPGSGVPASITSADCKLGTEGGQDTQAIRAQLRWIPNDNLDINLSADITDDNSGLAPNTLKALPGVNGTPGTPYALTNGTTANASFIPSDPYTSYATFCATKENNAINNADAAFTSYCVADHSTFKGRGVAGNVSWTIAPDLTLTSITAYRKYRTEFGGDGDEGPFDFQTNNNVLSSRQFSQELRLNGASFGKLLDWTVGGYYFDGHSVIGGRIHFPSLFDFTPNDPVDTNNKSAFVQTTWHLTDAFNVTAGYRYTKDAKDYQFSRFSATTPGTVSVPLAAIHGLENHYKGSRSDYKLALDYRWSPELMTYAQVSTGFRGGGTGPRPLRGNQGSTFQPETLTAYELGAKSDLFDQTLRLNAAVFVNKYKEIIFTSREPYFNPNLPVNNNPADPLYNPLSGTSPAAVPVNAGAATFKGAELELQWLPIKGLGIDASVSWIDFKFDSLSSQITGIPLDSDWLYTPKWKASLGLQYEMQVSAGGATLTPRIDGSYQSSFTTAVPTTAYSTVDGYTVANARLTWQSSSRDWEAVLRVTNVFDKVYYLNSSDLLSIGGVATASVAAPREWAISLKRKF